jgi:methyl-accepting chemotaxis protein
VLIRTRLALAFGALLAMMLVVAAVAFVALREAGDQAAALARQDLVLSDAAGAMQVAQLEQAVAIRDFVAQEDVAAEKSARQALARSEEAYAKAAAVVAERAKGRPDLEALAAKLPAAQDAIEQKMRGVMEQVENAEYDRARATVFRELLPMQRAIVSELTRLAGLTGELSQKRADTAESGAARALNQMAVVLVVTLFAGVLAILWLARGITRPLGSAVAITERVASGDLTGEIAAGSQDETGRLLAALERMQSNLYDVAASIRDGAQVVSQASEEIARGNTDLSQRNEAQASSLEEIVASVEEITSSVKQSADNAKSASAVANKAAEDLENGGKIVTRVVETMGGIQSASKRMSDIVGVIDGIAFQTNLLALNAAVEAARAGEQGRGFAVVASEVRALAQRSASAAKEIRVLIGDGVEQASAGAKLADEAGAAISGVVSAAKEVSRFVAEISHASQEQRSGMEQISSSVVHMDENTQRNAGLVEEINAATQSLLDQARALLQTVDRFKLDAAAVPVVVSPPRTEIAGRLEAPS